MNRKLPVISVVITAHDRKQYLLNAVNSILNQTFKRDLFEILVVKNYKDPVIDDYLKDHGIKGVLTEESSFGVKLALGIKASSGDIISFLDDDDSFTPDKLERVFKSFSESTDMNYFHNGIVLMNENGSIKRDKGELEGHGTINILKTPIGNFSELRDLSKYRGDWYMSCISIKRDSFLPFADFIGSISASLDRIFFIISINLPGLIMMDSRRLTQYRLHQSTTGLKSEFSDYCNRKMGFFKRTLNSIQAAESLQELSVVSKEYISFQMAHNEANKMLYDLNSSRLKRSRVLVSLLRTYNKTKDRIYLLIGSILLFSIVSPKSVIFIHYLYQFSRIT